ncbi:MAG: InlB B-repeat-containing protein [Erysipelotrichaceae bacterium]|nr:InlB B-repeat-containing protein [Erysipelotrichaceae bacterium]
MKKILLTFLFSFFLLLIPSVVHAEDGTDISITVTKNDDGSYVVEIPEDEIYSQISAHFTVFDTEIENPLVIYQGQPVECEKTNDGVTFLISGSGIYEVYDENVVSNKYSIIYVLNGEDVVNPASNRRYLELNEKLTLASPTRKGYTFSGWYTMNGIDNGKWGTKVSSVSSKSAGSITLYARWTPVKYTIKYNLNGGKNPKGVVTSYYVYTETFDLPVPEKKGYAFTGWYITENKIVSDELIASVEQGSTRNYTLTASYEIITYSITLDPREGEPAPKQFYDDRLEYDPADNRYYGFYNVTSVTCKLPNLVKDGYKFTGWYDLNTGKKLKSIAKGSVGDLDLYAGFTPVSYKITYKTNGGKILVKNDKNNRYYDTSFDIESVSLDLPSEEEIYRKGYIFDGWYLTYNSKTKEYSDKVESLDDLSYKNTTVYAGWIPITYTIQFRSDHYASDIMSVRYDETYKLSGDIFSVPGMKVQKYVYELNGKTVTVSATASIKNLVSEEGADPIVFRVAKDKKGNELWDVYSPAGKKLPVKERLGENVYTYCGTQIPVALGAPSLTNEEIDGLIAMVDSQRGLSPEEVDTSILDEVADRITTLADMACYLQRSKFTFTNKTLDNIDIFGPDVGNIGFSGDEFLYTISGAESLLVNEGQCSSTASLTEYLLHGDYDELGYIKISQLDNGHAMIYIQTEDKYYLIDPTEYVYKNGGTWLRFLNADKAGSQSLEELISIVHNANYPTPKEQNIKTIAYVYDGIFCMCGDDGWLNDPDVNIKLPVGSEVKVYIGFDHPAFGEPQHSTSQSTILGVILK